MYLNETYNLVILVYNYRNVKDFSRLVLIWGNFAYKKQCLHVK